MTSEGSLPYLKKNKSVVGILSHLFPVHSLRYLFQIHVNTSVTSKHVTLTTQQWNKLFYVKQGEPLTDLLHLLTNWTITSPRGVTWCHYRCVPEESPNCNGFHIGHFIVLSARLVPCLICSAHSLSCRAHVLSDCLFLKTQSLTLDIIVTLLSYYTRKQLSSGVFWNVAMDDLYGQTAYR